MEYDLQHDSFYYVMQGQWYVYSISPKLYGQFKEFNNTINVELSSNKSEAIIVRGETFDIDFFEYFDAGFEFKLVDDNKDIIDCLNKY